MVAASAVASAAMAGDKPPTRPGNLYCAFMESGEWPISSICFDEKDECEQVRKRAWKSELNKAAKCELQTKVEWHCYTYNEGQGKRGWCLPSKELCALDKASRDKAGRTLRRYQSTDCKPRAPAFVHCFKRRYKKSHVCFTEAKQCQDLSKKGCYSPAVPSKESP